MQQATTVYPSAILQGLLLYCNLNMLQIISLTIYQHTFDTKSPSNYYLHHSKKKTFFFMFQDSLDDLEKNIYSEVAVILMIFHSFSHVTSKTEIVESCNIKIKYFFLL